MDTQDLVIQSILKLDILDTQEELLHLNLKVQGFILPCRTWPLLPEGGAPEDPQLYSPMDGGAGTPDGGVQGPPWGG